MKNNNSIKKTIIPILSVLILAIVLNSCRYSDRKYYKTHTGKVVTIWNDYIIFEKYKGNKPPQDNYIRVLGKFKGSLKMCFKTNDSILIWRDFDENSLEIGFNSNKYKLEVFYGYHDKPMFDRKTHHEDSIFMAYYCFDSFPEDGNILFPLFSECIGDSVYIRLYKASPHFYKDHVMSRYDEALNK
jgi:hypothetical protein